VVAAEIRDSSTDSKILQPLSSPPRLRSIDLSFDGYILSGQLIELTLIALQCVDLAAAGKGKVRPLLDAFAGGVKSRKGLKTNKRESSI
jgi:hypothetical protein